MLSKLKQQIRQNLPTTALMIVIVVAITDYQQRDMTTGEAPKLAGISYSYSPRPALI